MKFHPRSICLTLIWIFILHGSQLFSQEILFDNFTISNGLPSNNVNAICGDELGYLWLGTDNGIIKFDGKRFVEIRGINQTFTQEVFSIKAISASNVWIGLRDGRVARYNGNSLEFIVRNYDGRNANLFVDSQNRLWIATEKNGLYLINNPEEPSRHLMKIIHYCKEHDMPDNVFEVAEDKNKQLWFLTKPGIKMFNKDKDKFIFYRPENLPRFTYYKMIVDSLKIFLGSDDGIVVIDQNVDKKNNIEVFEGPPYNQITSITKAAKGNYWFGTKTSGIIQYNNGKFKKLDKQSGLKGDKIKNLYTDIEGNVWIGHFENGLSGYKGSVFTRFNNFPEVGHASVYSLLYNNENKELWIGTDKGLFIASNESALMDLTGVPQLKNIPILSIIMIDSNTTALGTFGEGILLLRNLEIVKSYNRDRSEGNINKLALLATDQLLVAHSEGLYSIDLRTSQQHAYNLLQGIEVYDISVIDSGNFTVGTAGNGLFKYAEGIFSKYNDPVLADQTILCLHTRFLHDRPQEVLVGTTHVGLYSIVSKDKNVELRLKGNPSDRVSFIMEQKDNLWVGTDKGIINYNKNIEVITDFDRNSGFSNIEIKQGAACFASDSVLVFGTSEGLFFLNPGEYKKAQHLPILSIEKSFANDTISITNGAKLSYSNNNLLFKVSSVSLSLPYSLNTQYRLSGLYEQWQSVNDNMEIRFQKLPPGDYRLDIRSSTDKNYFKRSESYFTFSILPPFWQTIPFYLLIGLLIAGLIILFYKYKLKRALERQQKKHNLDLKLAELELKSFRSQMNPHFIFNSLQSIQNYINESKADDANDYLVKFSKLMRLILENSINDTVPLEDDLKALELYMQLESARLVFPLTYEIKIDDDIDPGSIFIPPLLIQPFVENAIWHGLLPKQAPGMIKIIFSFRKNNLHCIIEDNGVGRKSNKGGGNVLKKKSLGVKITRDRLALQSVRLKTEWGVHFTDLFNEQNLPSGTRVELLIPVEI